MWCGWPGWSCSVLNGSGTKAPSACTPWSTLMLEHTRSEAVEGGSHRLSIHGRSPSAYRLPTRIRALPRPRSIALRTAAVPADTVPANQPAQHPASSRPATTRPQAQPRPPRSPARSYQQPSSANDVILAANLGKQVAPLQRRAERDLLPGDVPNTPWRRLAYQLKLAPTLHDLLDLFIRSRYNDNVWGAHHTALVLVRTAALLYPKAVAASACSSSSDSTLSSNGGPSPGVKRVATSVFESLSGLLSKDAVRQVQSFHAARMLVVMSWLQVYGEKAESLVGSLVRELQRQRSRKLAEVAMVDPALFGRLVRALAQLAPRDDQLWVDLQRLTLAALMQGAATAEFEEDASFLSSTGTNNTYSMNISSNIGSSSGRSRRSMRPRRLWGSGAASINSTTPNNNNNAGSAAFLPDCSIEDLANMAFGFAAADRAIPPLFDALREAVLSRGELPPEPHTLANLLWAWCSARLPAGDLPLRVVEAFRSLLDVTPPRPLGRVLWSLGVLGLRNKAFLAAASEAIVRRKLVFGSAQELVNVCWAFSHMGWWVRVDEEGGAAAGVPRRAALGASVKEDGKPRGARRRAPEQVSEQGPRQEQRYGESEWFTSPVESRSEDVEGADGASSSGGPGVGGAGRGRWASSVQEADDNGSLLLRAGPEGDPRHHLDPDGNRDADANERRQARLSEQYSPSEAPALSSAPSSSTYSTSTSDPSTSGRDSPPANDPEADGLSLSPGRSALRLSGVASSLSPSVQPPPSGYEPSPSSTASSSTLSTTSSASPPPMDTEQGIQEQQQQETPPLVMCSSASLPASTGTVPDLGLHFQPLPVSAVWAASAARHAAAVQAPPLDPASPLALYRFLAHCYVNGHVTSNARWAMTDAQLAVLAASFARAGYGNKSLFYTMARMAMRRMASLAPLDLTLLLVAHAQVRVQHKALFEAGCEYVQRRWQEFSPRQLADVLWAVQVQLPRQQHMQLVEALRQRHDWREHERGRERELCGLIERHMREQGGMEDSEGEEGGGEVHVRAGSWRGDMGAMGMLGSREEEGLPAVMQALYVPAHLLVDEELEGAEEEGEEDGDGGMWLGRLARLRDGDLAGARN